jgi:ElaB/YqjD/DUF883 family membrane-anchored ribosome-binding protein
LHVNVRNLRNAAKSRQHIGQNRACLSESDALESRQEWHMVCEKIHMQTNTSFPNTRQDIENLKQTTLEAAKDIGNTASVHAQKARTQVRELASHAKEETLDQLNRAQGSFSEILDSVQNYISARPLASIAVAFGVGLVLGFNRRR